MGWFDKIKEVVKKTAQTVIPGGSRGYLEPKKAPVPTPVAPRPTEEAGVMSVKQTDIDMGVRPQTGTQIVGRDTSPSQALRGEGVATYQKIITPEETKAGLVQEDIDNGLSISSIGTVNPITTSDILAVTGLPALAKTGLVSIGRIVAGKAAKAGVKNAGALYQTALIPGWTPTKVATNVATQKLANKKLLGSFSAKAIALMGGAATWAGAVAFGKWGQAEGPEAITFQMKSAMALAEETGDWSIYDEAKAARDELLDLSKWEELMLWSPLSPLKGDEMKIEGGITAGIIQDKIADERKEMQETGMTSDDIWKRNREEQAVQEKANVDYYNDERKKLLEWEREASKDARDEDAAFWRNERAKQRQKEAEDREAIAKFWEAYKREMQKLAEDSRPSNLNFGMF